MKSNSFQANFDNNVDANVDRQLSNRFTVEIHVTYAIILSQGRKCLPTMRVFSPKIEPFYCRKRQIHW